MFTLHYGLHGRQTPKGPSTPEDSADSLPPRLLQLLPVETKVTGRDSHPLKNSALARRTTEMNYVSQSCLLSFYLFYAILGFNFNTDFRAGFNRHNY